MDVSDFFFFQSAFGWQTVFQIERPHRTGGTDIAVYLAYQRVNDTLHLDMTEKQQLAMAEKIEYPVRKAAHMTEYAILGLLSFAFYRGILKKEKRQFLAALLTAAVYAATDEFHQYFIPGRSAEVMDVCIDTLGASIGLAILFFTLKVVRKHCQKSKLTLQ